MIFSISICSFSFPVSLFSCEISSSSLSHFDFGGCTLMDNCHFVSLLGLIIFIFLYQLREHNDSSLSSMLILQQSIAT